MGAGVGVFIYNFSQKFLFGVGACRLKIIVCVSGS